MSGHSHWATIKHKKGRHRRQARQAVEQAEPGHHHRGPPRRRRPEHEPQAALRHRQGPRSQHAQGQHRTRHQARHRRDRGRQLRGNHLRGLSAPAASPSSSTSSPTTATAPPARSARSSSAAAARWASAGCVGYLFERKGLFSVEADGHRRGHADGHRARCRRRRHEPPGRELRDRLRSRVVQQGAGGADRRTRSRPSTAEITQLPRSRWTSMPRSGARSLRCIEALDDHDDVQNVYSSANIPDEVLAEG